MAVESWQGWRRPRGKSLASWKKVPGTAGPTAAAVYCLLMEVSENEPAVSCGSDGKPVWHEEGPWEYAIMPEGQVPKAKQEPPGERMAVYRNRMLHLW